MKTIATGWNFISGTDFDKKKEVYRIYEFFEGMKEQIWFMEGLEREVNLLRLRQRASELRDMNTNKNEIVFIDVKDDTYKVVP